MTAPSSAPIPYSPAFEQPEEDEAETAAELVQTLLSISEKTFADSGQALRSVHAKGHGFLVGALEVLPDLPPELAQGLFATPARYPVQMRLSTTPGDIMDDNVSTPRGLGLKVLGGAGEQAPQDFVLVNGPSFLAPSAKAFLKNLKLLAQTTDQAEGLKKALSAALRAAEAALEAVGGKSATLISLGGHPRTHILGETFFSQAPILYGRYMAKISLAPASENLKALKDAALDLDGKPNGIREAVRNFFRTEAGVWELRAQLCTDLEAMPIEDSSIAWPEDQSPYRTVARISAPPQEVLPESEEDGGLSFSPWHCGAAHRPLGSIMRVRKPAYAASADFRASHNGCPVH